MTYYYSYFNALTELRFSVRASVCLLAVVFGRQDFFLVDE
jgi:hypothetical protein